VLPNEPKPAILLAAKQKRDYRAIALVIPTPTPEWPRRQAREIIAQSRFLGKWGGGFLVARARGCWGTGSPTTVARVNL